MSGLCKRCTRSNENKVNRVLRNCDLCAKEAAVDYKIFKCCAQGCTKQFCLCIACHPHFRCLDRAVQGMVACFASPAHEQRTKSSALLHAWQKHVGRPAYTEAVLGEEQLDNVTPGGRSGSPTLFLLKRLQCWLFVCNGRGSMRKV